MKKTLSLTITDPSEETELDAALHAMDFMLVISNTLSELRDAMKYGDDALEGGVCEKVRDDIWKLICDYDLERFFP